jgi:hypothetical protein
MPITTPNKSLNMDSIDKFDAIKKEFPEYLKRNLGNITVACEKVGINRQTYYNWRANDPEFDTACYNVIEGLKDRAESLFYKKMFVDEDTTSLIFFAKTKMKDRGYVERTETTGKDGEPITQVNYTVEIAKARLKELTGAIGG